MSRTDYYHEENAPEAQKIVPAVSAVIQNGQYILLQQRSDNGKWSLPGGNMDAGESVLEAIIREVKEETGLICIMDRITGIYSDPRHIIAYSDGEVRQQFSICFAGKPVGGEVCKSEESFDIAWVHIDILDDYDIHPAQRIRIADALKNCKSAFIR
ncbi:NUDIX domain-containing protein [Terribacillus sp. 7520-G]|uniref:NUDIX domain-containing protein n=1 Tax=Terribacillus TaxID=459532 RepID=UPI000BA71EFE|nr:NUDIX domain-containing protein [Terribacillus sp. 7520-G]PAD39623.1 NUDIX hydrolase [Terribacillus sp. 7520-G]